MLLLEEHRPYPSGVLESLRLCHDNMWSGPKTEVLFACQDLPDVFIKVHQSVKVIQSEITFTSCRNSCFFQLFVHFSAAKSLIKHFVWKLQIQSALVYNWQENLHFSSNTAFSTALQVPEVWADVQSCCSLSFWGTVMMAELISCQLFASEAVCVWPLSNVFFENSRGIWLGADLELITQQEGFSSDKLVWFWPRKIETSVPLSLESNKSNTVNSLW